MLPTPQRTPGPAVQKSRITVTEQVVYHLPGKPPFPVATAFEQTATDVPGEPLTLPPITVGPDWIAVDFSAWPRLGQITVKNTEGKFTVRPTADELAEVMARVIEIGFGDAPAGDNVVRPGASQRFDWPDPSRARFRCKNGTAVMEVSVFPG